jgi:hypothetical protein
MGRIFGLDRGVVLPSRLEPPFWGGCTISASTATGSWAGRDMDDTGKVEAMDIGIWIGCVAVVAALVGASRWAERRAFLRLSLFRPYRGEAWPRGVQEEYDVPWRWAGPRLAGVERDDISNVSVTRVAQIVMGRKQQARPPRSRESSEG